jgi:hypothetical protein
MAEHEQRLPHQIRVLNDPALQRQLIDAPLKRDGLERCRRAAVDLEQPRRERIHDAVVPDERARREDGSRGRCSHVAVRTAAALR